MRRVTSLPANAWLLVCVFAAPFFTPACGGESRQGTASGGKAAHAEGGNANGGRTTGGLRSSGGVALGGGSTTGGRSGSTSSGGSTEGGRSGSNGSGGSTGGVTTGGVVSTGGVCSDPPLPSTEDNDPRCGAAGTRETGDECPEDGLVCHGATPGPGLPTSCNRPPPQLETSTCCGGRWWTTSIFASVTAPPPFPPSECPFPVPGAPEICPEEVPLAGTLCPSEELAPDAKCDYQTGASMICCEDRWEHCLATPTSSDCACPQQNPEACSLVADDPDASLGGRCGIGDCVPPPDVAGNVSSQPLGQGEGGEIRSGTYLLTRLVQHEDRGCYLIRGSHSEVLRMADGRGWIVSRDGNFLNWEGKFDYAVTGSNIEFTMTCNVPSSREPFGPFGPYDSFTAGEIQLDLFSSSCGIAARYTRAP